MGTALAQLVTGPPLVAEADGAVVATMQLSYLPGLARRGAVRAQIEAVRVHQDYRGRGLGEAMFRWAIAEARGRGCALVQLTTDKSRGAAHRFYERLGFVSSHEGMKLSF
jgi:GNAT superfamily N-acetyltransferase